MAKKNEAPAPVAAAENWDDAPAVTAIKANDDGVVRVKCIVKTQPWTDKKALDENEEADVSAEVAEAMLQNGQVVVL